MNPLTNLSPNVRATVYSLYALVGVVLGATQVGFQASENGFPVWLKVTLSVYAFVGTAVGLTAVSNTPTRQHRRD